MQNDIEQKPEFNMAILFLTRLDKRNDDADIAILEENLMRYYRSLKNIWLMFKYKAELNKDKKWKDQTYSDIIREIDKGFIESGNLLTGSESLVKKNYTTTERKLEMLREKMYSLLWGLNLIFPEKYKIIWEEEIKNDFK